MKNERAMLVIYGFMKLINVFLGPFLTAYFVKISIESVTTVSLFNAFNYLFLAIFGMIAGYYVEKKDSLFVLRLGIIAKFLCVLLIMLLGTNITSYYGIVSFVFGFAQMFFYIPFDLYHAEGVEKERRTSFELKLNGVKDMTSVLGPILLGATITIINYQMTAIIILLFSLCQIIASFYLKPILNDDNNYNLISALKKLMKNKEHRKLFLVQYLNGMTFSDSALSTAITILIMMSFKTDFNLGVITSLTSLFSLIAIYIYTKKYKNKSDSVPLYFSGIIIFLSMILLILKTSSFTIVIYNVILGIFGAGILNFAYILRLVNTAKEKIVSEEKAEFWAISELFLNIGRVTGFVLLLFVGILGLDYLVYFLIFIGLIVLIFPYFLSNIDRN